MSIMSRIRFYFSSNFYKLNYKKILESENEEIYRKNDKLVVLVKSEEIGEQIYNIIKALKQITIQTSKMTFKIDDYIIENKSKVKLFTAEFAMLGEWSELTKLEKLEEIVDFTEEMHNKGFVLDSTKFDSEKCNNITNFLSLFVEKEEDVDFTNSKGCLIKHIHYTLSENKEEQELEEFYKDKIHKITPLSDFPYGRPVIEMCYNYFANGNIKNDIYLVLMEADQSYAINFYENYDSYLIASNSSFSSLPIVEENREYIIYNGNIKIYYNMSPEFEKFLKDRDSLTLNNRKSIETVENIILDFNGRVIGYKFVEPDMEGKCTILENRFRNQEEIIDFIYEIDSYLGSLIQETKYTVYENKFDIEKSLICKDYYYRIFGIKNIEELYKLSHTHENCLKEQITKVFFKLLLEYLNKKYGNISDEKQFLEKEEVRYLSPVVAKEFIKYALGKQVDYQKAIEEFYVFLYNTKSNQGDWYYDSRFEYNPLFTPFIFDYEAEKKYGIKIETGMNETLADGRKLVTFNKSKRVSLVKDKEKSTRQRILDEIGDLEDYNVKILGISELIYSNNINAENMHNVVGYITDEVEGHKLTKEVLLKLNNKELFYVIGYLFLKFAYCNMHICLDSIWMDKDFKFYINIMDEEFKILKHRPYGSDFIKELCDYFMDNGYNPNAFIDVSYWYKDVWYWEKSDFIYNADRMDAYCKKHDIYYDSTNKRCPVCLKTRYFVSEDFETNKRTIFEDQHAKHYRLGKDYNIKIYKRPSSIDMGMLEKNIDRKLNKAFIPKEEFGQECFIPIKKAVDDNDNFVGYIYKAVNFQNVEDDAGSICVDIKSQTMKNLPRLKCLTRLIAQVKELVKKDLGFIQNPFTNVLLSKDHKKQVQILNIEFLTKNKNKKEILKWTCDYVKEVLASDTSIEVDITNCSTDLDAIIKKLQNLEKEMTKYCSLHRIYYKNSYLFCPKCIDKDAKKDIEVIETEVSKVACGDDNIEGGQSFIYPYGKDFVAKVFKEDAIIYEFKCMILLRILKKKDVLEGINNQNLKYKYIIPKKLFLDKKMQKVFGYTMNKVKDGLPLSILRDTMEVERLGITRKDVLEIFINIAKGIETLHANNIYIGDLNSQNILFDKDKNVYFLDFDGMGIDELKTRSCTVGYIDPLSDKNNNITMKDDYYSFAIQAFYYLTFAHPFNGQYLVEEKGVKRNLSIPERMERRLSLLGPHGIKPPAIAQPWDWMNKDLEKAFLNTFEGDKRESILPELIKQYETLCGIKVNEETQNVRINSIFEVNELDTFGKDVVHIINHIAAVCKTQDKNYVKILGYNNVVLDIDFEDCMQIKDLLLSEDKEIAFAIYEDHVIAKDLRKNTEMFCKLMLYKENSVVDGRTLYVSTETNDGYVIKQIACISNQEIQEEYIEFLPEKVTKAFNVKNSKFVIVKRSSDGITHEIYCNSEKLCESLCFLQYVKYNIIYDEVTKLWLVVNNEGIAILIKRDGTYQTMNFNGIINEENLENISFHKGIMYIPCQNYLCLINILKDQIVTKKMECDKFMAPSSKLHITDNGFIVITRDILYEFRRE